jgi:hypothetical protein
LPIRPDTFGHFFSVVQIIPDIPANHLPAGKELAGRLAAGKSRDGRQREFVGGGVRDEVLPA